MDQLTLSFATGQKLSPGTTNRSAAATPFQPGLLADIGQDRLSMKRAPLFGKLSEKQRLELEERIYDYRQTNGAITLWKFAVPLLRADLEATPPKSPRRLELLKATAHIGFDLNPFAEDVLPLLEELHTKVSGKTLAEEGLELALVETRLGEYWLRRSGLYDSLITRMLRDPIYSFEHKEPTNLEALQLAANYLQKSEEHLLKLEKHLFDKSGRPLSGKETDADRYYQTLGHTYIALGELHTVQAYSHKLSRRPNSAAASHDAALAFLDTAQTTLKQELAQASPDRKPYLSYRYREALAAAEIACKAQGKQEEAAAYRAKFDEDIQTGQPATLVDRALIERVITWLEAKLK